MQKNFKNEKFTVWLTGLPCSGKTTIANKLHATIFQRFNDNFICLDGDDLRCGLNEDLGFSDKDRYENIRRVSHVAELFNKRGINVICSFVSPTEELRNLVEKNIKNIVVVYVECSKEECAKRDVKGMWKKAYNGEIKFFTGVDGVFEEPVNPDIIVNTESSDLDSCVSFIIYKLENLTS